MQLLRLGAPARLLLQQGGQVAQRGHVVRLQRQRAPVQLFRLGAWPCMALREMNRSL